jgi:hypothetical protein
LITEARPADPDRPVDTAVEGIHRAVPGTRFLSDAFAGCDPNNCNGSTLVPCEDLK